jgi:hypothetical protein
MLVQLMTINASNYITTSGILGSHTGANAECHLMGCGAMQSGINPFWQSPQHQASLRYKELHVLSHTPHNANI